MYTVYKHTTPSGKVYIGITKQKPEQRWENGNGYQSNKHFYSAIQKYGWDNIEHEIVENGLTKQQACDLEIELIAKYHATDRRYGYNNSTGGECGSLGVHPSAETRLKISESLNRAYLNPELRQKLSEAQKGKHRSPETRRKMSEARKCSNSPWYGEHLSAEHRSKISEAEKGRLFSHETRQKISEAKKGAHHSDEARRKMSEAHRGKIHRNRKAVICVETGTLYSSSVEAAKAIGVTQGAISHAACGITQTSGGYHWRYADDRS